MSPVVVWLGACGTGVTTDPHSPTDASHETGTTLTSGETGARGETGSSATSAETGGTTPTLDELWATCVTTVELDTGTLCVLRPSTLEPGALDEADTGSVVDRLLGFGDHVVGVPHTPDPAKGLWVHFGGTYGRPHDPHDSDIAASMWIGELMGQGYTVLQPAYDNVRSVNDDCQAPPGVDRDDCAGEIREEVLTGVDVSPYRSTAVVDAVEHRVLVLLAHLAEHAPSVLPPGLDTMQADWPSMSVSGHSQGGNLAYYVARFRGVRFGCLLASPYDLPDNVNSRPPPIADWFKRGTPLTLPEDLGQLITTEDPSANGFRQGGSYIGLRAGIEAFEVSAPPYHNEEGVEVDGHAAPLADPALAPYRAQACFR
ncbi:MAG: hypothetical protein KC621_13505 [Myxococcales bacterium]|nr:hypothetical protein [Myxococcales bacterium]